MEQAGSEVLELASLDKFSRLWGIWAVPSYLVPGPGVFGGSSGSEYKSLIKELAGHLGSGLVGFHIKGILTDNSFIFFKNSLTLRGAVPSGSAKPQISMHQKHMFNPRFIS